MTLEPIVDLFLDLWIAPVGRFEVLDEDEFEEAVARGILTEQQTDRARSVLPNRGVSEARRKYP